MLDWKSTETFESGAFPGVKYTVRKPSVAGRAELQLALAPIVDQYDEKLKKLRAMLIPEGDVKALPDLSEEEKKLLADGKRVYRYRDEQAATVLHMEITAINNLKLNPAYVRWGLTAIEGMQIDGVPPDAGRLINDGPEELIREIAIKIQEVMGLSGEQQKN